MTTGNIIRASTSANGGEGNGWSGNARLSADGRSVVFTSDADNLVEDDTNGERDIFVKDIKTGAIVRASTAANGTQGNAGSSDGRLSADGRYVTFTSEADNLVPNDTNGAGDVFVKDLETGAIVLVSTAADGTQGNAGSGDGRLSADGRKVAFSSLADNLVENDINGDNDVFVKNLDTGAIVLASTAGDGGQNIGGVDLSADGRKVAFSSWAGDFHVFVKDLETGIIVRASTAVDGAEANGMADPLPPSLSDNGRYVAFTHGADNLVPNDTNSVWDVFVKDSQTGDIVRANTAVDGEQGNSLSFSPNDLSADGRYVTFTSEADNLVPNDTNGALDVFVKDLETGAIVLASTAGDGAQGNGFISGGGYLSADGRTVVFTSDADNLVKDDTNGEDDVFVKDLSKAFAAEPILGTPDDDVLIGTTAGDFIYGLGGSDNLDGGGGNDFCKGGEANDSLAGGGGEDSLYGDSGNDKLDGGAGDDFLTGGPGVDIFQVTGNAFGHDLITDFDVATDVLWFAPDTGIGGFKDLDTDGSGILDEPDDAVTIANSFTRIEVDGNSVTLRDAFVREFTLDCASMNPLRWSAWGDCDPSTRSIIRASTATDGTEGNAASDGPRISEDGRYLLFTSSATNLVPEDGGGAVDNFIKDLETGAIERVDPDAPLEPWGIQDSNVSASGRYVAEGNQVTDTETGESVRFDTAADGTPANGESLTIPNHNLSISADGRYVLFLSAADNLVPDDTNDAYDFFVKDMETGAIVRANTAADGTQSTGAGTEFGDLSADGRYVVLNSAADDLVHFDTNGHTDTFVKDLKTGAIVRANTPAGVRQADGPSILLTNISADGRSVAFVSDANNLVPNDTNGVPDVFVRELSSLFGTEGEIVTGTRNDDDLSGTSYDDIIIGQSGNDIVNGGSGNDDVYGDGDSVAGCVQVSFVSEDAENQSTYGWYNTETLEAGILVPTVDSRATKPGLVAGLPMAPDDLEFLGFFLIPDGYRWNSEPFSEGDGTDLNLEVFRDGGAWEIRDSNSGYTFERAIYFTDPAMNPDHLYHVREDGDLAADGVATQNWEDGSDADFNDAVFEVRTDYTVEVSFAGEDAGYQSTYGWYHTGTGEAQILVANVDANTNPDLAGFTASLSLTADEIRHLGFFLIPDGYDQNGDPGEPFSDSSGTDLDLEVFEDDGTWKVRDTGSGDVFEGAGGSAYFTDPAMNPDTLDHVMEAGDLLAGGAATQNWEDLPGLGDADFDDLVFEVSLGCGSGPSAREGNDLLNGGSGNDSLFGGGGADSLDGGDGDDWLRGGGDDDEVTGGEDEDTFILSRGEGTDTIVDFEVGVDHIGLADGLTFGDLSFDRSEIMVAEQTLAVVEGVDAVTLEEFDFVMV